MFNASPGLISKISDIERRFLTLRSSGTSIREIAKKLKKSTHTICEWNKKFSKDLLELRNKVFCNLQQKIIDSKTERLEFLKKELARISEEMKNAELHPAGFNNPYGDALNLYLKLSDMISVCEIDLLKVGINFRENIEPELNLDTVENESSENVAPVSENNNAEPENMAKETIEKSESKDE
ncbi:MAG: hypothetical protein HY959_08425 [Ignavibacteriae bacterium]|nr:hypothetical protein [Ignavibacteriota bacterium]